MDKKMIERQLANMDLEILSELKAQLADEMKKPDGERDETLILDLKETIAETQQEIVDASEKRSFENVMKMLDEYDKPSHSKLCKRLAVAAACIIMVLGANTASLKVFGMNAISAAYQLTKGGIIISAETNDNNELKTSESDPYGMKAKCAEYGFFPDTPDYIPDGYVLDHIWEDSNEETDIVTFFYKNGKSKLNFDYTYYKNDTQIPPIGIPTDTYNITEENINDTTVYILKEDKQFTAVCIDKHIRYSIFAEQLDYNDCEKVLYDMLF